MRHARYPLGFNCNHFRSTRPNARFQSYHRDGKMLTERHAVLKLTYNPNSGRGSGTTTGFCRTGPLALEGGCGADQKGD